MIEDLKRDRSALAELVSASVGLSYEWDAMQNTLIDLDRAIEALETAPEAQSGGPRDVGTPGRVGGKCPKPY